MELAKSKGLKQSLILLVSCDISVSKVSSHDLDKYGLMLAVALFLFALIVSRLALSQTIFEAQPFSYPGGDVGSFTRDKACS
jgi:hypothetical protein